MFKVFWSLKSIFSKVFFDAFSFHVIGSNVIIIVRCHIGGRHYHDQLAYTMELALTIFLVFFVFFSGSELSIHLLVT